MIKYVYVLMLVVLTTGGIQAQETAETSKAIQIDINTADPVTLAHALEGIGEKKAQAIIEYRNEHGPFTSIYQLVEVYGIGEKTIERNKDKILVVLPEENTVNEEDSSSQIQPVMKLPRIPPQKTQAETNTEASSTETEK